ncbi:MAG: DUF6516 family protein [Nitrospirota bacterium]
MVDAYLEEIIRELFIHPSISAFKVVRQEASDEEGYIRVKCSLSNGGTLEFSEYVEQSAGSIQIITYNYHWQNAKGALVKRWDNVEHHKKIRTFPHHLHLSDEKVVDSSPMNLKRVLQEIEKYLTE